MALISLLPKHIQAKFRAKYFALQHRAWQAHAYVAELPIGDKFRENSWRKEEMLKEVGVDSFSLLDHLNDFDRIMLHWAIIAQDDGEIAYWTRAEERRYRHLIKERMQELAWIEKCVYDWHTVRRILDHMNLCERIEDCPAEHLRTVFMALDTHLRRSCKELGVKPADLRAEMRRAA